MASLKVRRAPVINLEITVPGDKSISHRAVILAALSNGACVLRNFLPSADCLCTVNAMRQLGVEIEHPEPETLIVHGCHRQLEAPAEPIDCGNSGTTMRLLSGLLAAQPFESRLTGDQSLSERPMDRVILPLREMGAEIESEGGGAVMKAPLRIKGKKLTGIEYEMSVASAQVKSAILLAGMFSEGKTTVIEKRRTRDHTERLLRYFLVGVRREKNRITVYGGETPESRDFTIPGDISSAAFWMCAAAAQRGSFLVIRDVGLNETRTGIFDVLIRMGASIREYVQELDQEERSGTLEIKGNGLRGTMIEGDEIPSVIDELPVLAVAASVANGQSLFREADELRVKETDRLSALVQNLRAMDANVTEYADGIEIRGNADLKGTQIDSFGDHRIAMAFAIAGLLARGETTIEESECIGISYPGFKETLAEFMRPTSAGPTRLPTPRVTAEELEA